LVRLTVVEKKLFRFSGSFALFAEILMMAPLLHLNATFV